MASIDISDREDLRVAVRGTLDRYSSSQQVRAVTEGDRRFNGELWGQMNELGWTSLLVPEDYGGADAGMSAAVVVLRALGEHFTPSPYLRAPCWPHRFYRGGPHRGRRKNGYRRWPKGRPLRRWR